MQPPHPLENCQIPVLAKGSRKNKSCAIAAVVSHHAVIAHLVLLCRIFVAPAAYLRVHQGNCPLNGGVYSQIGRIKQVRIFCGFERRGGAILVAFVAGRNVGKDVVKIDRFAALLHFFETASSPGLG